MSDTRYPVPLNEDGTLPRFINSDNRMVKSDELGTWVPYECVRVLLEPVRALLTEARRGHDRGYNDESCDYPPCPKSDEDAQGACTCNVEMWNARIDLLLRQTHLPGDKS